MSNGFLLKKTLTTCMSAFIVMAIDSFLQFNIYIEVQGGIQKMEKLITPDLCILGVRGYSRLELARALNISKHTLSTFAVKKIGPKFIRFGNKAFYPEKEVKKWFEGKLQGDKK